MAYYQNPRTVKCTVALKQFIADKNIAFQFQNETLRLAFRIIEELTDILYDPAYSDLVHKLVNGESAMLSAEEYVLDFAPSGNERFVVTRITRQATKDFRTERSRWRSLYTQSTNPASGSSRSTPSMNSSMYIQVLRYKINR